MNRTTAASAAFLALALVVAGWLLMRPHPQSSDEGDAAVVVTAAGLTFAEWSTRSDAVLLANIDPGLGGAAGSTVPRVFTVFSVQEGPPPTLKERGSFSWAPADRVKSAAALGEQGFTVSTEGLAFIPPGDPLWSDPIVRHDGGTEQVVTLRGHGAPQIVATLTRHRGDAKSAPYWNRRAIGFAAADGHLVYVTPDAVLVLAKHAE